MKLTASHTRQLIEMALAAAPREACGLLAGNDGAVRTLMPLTNVEHNPKGCGWRADSREQFLAFQRMDERGEELIAVFHSHPRSAAYPSERDVEHALYPDARYVVVSLLEPKTPDVKAFRIVDGRVTEEDIEIVAVASTPAQGG